MIIVIRSLRNASEKDFLNFHPRASLVKIVLSFRSPIWLHYWHLYHNYVTKPFPEMIIDRYSKKKTGLIKREASQHFDFKVFRRLVWKHFLNFMMCTPHTCNWDNWNMVEVTKMFLQWIPYQPWQGWRDRGFAVCIVEALLGVELWVYSTVNSGSCSSLSSAKSSCKDIKQVELHLILHVLNHSL